MEEMEDVDEESNDNEEGKSNDSKKPVAQEAFVSDNTAFSLPSNLFLVLLN